MDDKTIKLLFDTLNNPSKTGDCIKTVLESGTDFLYIASPYISEINSLPISEIFKKYKEVKIICDLSQNATNPVFIQRLLLDSKNIQVKSLSRIHAKVYLTKNQIILGSANFTEPGVGIGNYECGVFLDDEKSCNEGKDWFLNLWNSPMAKDSSEISRLEWEQFESAFNLRERQKTGSKPLLYDLLLSNQIDNVLFGFYEEDYAELTEKELRDKLENHILPESLEYWERENDYDDKIKKKILESKPIFINLNLNKNSDDDYTTVQSIDKVATRYFDVRKIGKIYYEIHETITNLPFEIDDKLKRKISLGISKNKEKFNRQVLTNPELKNCIITPKYLLEILLN